VPLVTNIPTTLSPSFFATSEDIVPVTSAWPPSLSTTLLLFVSGDTGVGTQGLEFVRQATTCAMSHLGNQYGEGDKEGKGR
jgi:hypothetical protein